MQEVTGRLLTLVAPSLKPLVLHVVLGVMQVTVRLLFLLDPVFISAGSKPSQPLISESNSSALPKPLQAFSLGTPC